MKMLLIPLFLVCFNILDAQDFQYICTPGTTYFEGHDHYFKGFRPDTWQALGNSDTLFTSYRAIRDSAGFASTCKDTTSGDALGREVLKLHDGWFLFFNRLHDTIRINTQATLNESWKYCTLPDPVHSYLQATVTEIITDSVCGTTDLVKVITFQSKNASGNNIPGIFNQKSIRLSKHYGLSKVYDIYMTPYDTLPLVLAGKSSPVIGAQPFDWKAVYNFEPGDEFHYAGYEMYNTSTVTMKKIRRILEKTVYGNMDSVRYQVQECIKTWYPAPPPNTASSFDTISEIYNFVALATDPSILMMPDEFKSNGNGAPAVSHTWSEFNHRPVQMVNPAAYVCYFGDHCYNAPFESFGPVFSYAPGLGLTNRYEEYADIGLTRKATNLVWFKKGAETWGTPVATDCSGLITGIAEGVVKRGIEVFPNPARSGITVRIENTREVSGYQYCLYNYSGALVSKGPVAANPLIIQRNQLSPGIYLLILYDSKGEIVGKSNVSFQ